VVEELNSGLPRNNSSWWSERQLDPRSLDLKCGTLVGDQFHLRDTPTGNHGICTYQNKYPIEDDENNYHDSLYTCLIEEIGHWPRCPLIGQMMREIDKEISLMEFPTISTDYIPEHVLAETSSGRLKNCGSFVPSSTGNL